MCVETLFPGPSGAGWRNSWGATRLAWSLWPRVHCMQRWGRVSSFHSFWSVWMFLWLWTHWLLVLGTRWQSSGAWNWKVMRMINQIPSSKGCPCQTLSWITLRHGNQWLGPTLGCLVSDGRHLGLEWTESDWRLLLAWCHCFIMSLCHGLLAISSGRAHLVMENRVNMSCGKCT